MNQRDDKHLRQNINSTDIYTKSSSNKNLNEPLAEGKEFRQEPDSTNNIIELLAPYYDEFHFANYE